MLFGEYALRASHADVVAPTDPEQRARTYGRLVTDAQPAPSNMPKQLQDVVRRHRVKLVLKPYDFQAVVSQTGGIPIRTRPQPRRSYHAEELARWRDYLGMPLTLEPKHYPQSMPADPDWNKYAGWMVIAAQQQGLDAFVLSHALLRALWAEERDTSQADVRIAVADENGYDGAALQALEQAAETLAAYRANSADAIQAATRDANVQAMLAKMGAEAGEETLDVTQEVFVAAFAASVKKLVLRMPFI